MIRHNLNLIIISAVILTGSVALASVQYDGAPDPNEQTQSTRKSGDMYVYYHGYSGRRGVHRGMSTRRGSLHNRSYRGGGLRGGK